MKIQEFYDEDPRRRASEEKTYGHAWSDGKVPCEVSWVRDTGELYMLQHGRARLDGVGLLFTAAAALITEGEGLLLEQAMTVEVLGVIGNEDDVERVLVGWEDAMTKRNSIQWLRDRLARAGYSTQ